MSGNRPRGRTKQGFYPERAAAAVVGTQSRPFLKRRANSVRAVIDVNVVVSGLLWHGTPHTLIERLRIGTLRLVSSPVLLAEMPEVLERPKLNEILARSNTSLERALAEMQTFAKVMAPVPLPKPLCRDPDGDETPALAVAARVDLIVSGDTDPLDLDNYEGSRS